MDISFKTPSGRFNFRVSAVIIRGDCLLIVQDDICSYAYLPGGRVKMGEPAADALRRELREELHADLRLLRPLWVCEDFYTDADSGEPFHEIGVYYLVDGAPLPDTPFAYPEGDRINRFEWVSPGELQGRCFLPEFVKDRILRLPLQPELLTILEQE